MSISQQRIAIIKEIGALEIRAEKGENVTTKIRHCGKRLEALGKLKKRVNVMDASGEDAAEEARIAAKIADSKLRREWKAVATRNGLGRGAYAYRIKKGMSYEEAATTPKSTDVPNEYLIRAHSNGISNAVYWNRLNRGWSKERACTEPLDMSRVVKEKGVKV